MIRARTSFVFYVLLVLLLATLAGMALPAFADSMQVELTPYTPQAGYALLMIDDAAQTGKIVITVEVLGDPGGQLKGLFLNLQSGRPQNFSGSWVTGPSVLFAEVDTKDLGKGLNANPSPSGRPKGLFDLGIAFSGGGTATFTIDNPTGQLGAFYLGPFVIVADYPKPFGGTSTAKLYGVPVVPVASAGKPATPTIMQGKSARRATRKVL